MQLAEMERKRSRQKQESAKSVAAKRRARLATEITELQAQQARAEEQIAALVTLIFRAQTEIAEAEKAAERWRRIVLLLAASA